MEGVLQFLNYIHIVYAIHLLGVVNNRVGFLSSGFLDNGFAEDER
jgi:hypothetical protein